MRVGIEQRRADDKIDWRVYKPLSLECPSAVSLYCFLGVGCFAGIFAHTAELPHPRQNT